jgi:hypothetical protein
MVAALTKRSSIKHHPGKGNTRIHQLCRTNLAKRKLDAYFPADVAILKNINVFRPKADENPDERSKLSARFVLASVILARYKLPVLRRAGTVGTGITCGDQGLNCRTVDTSCFYPAVSTERLRSLVGSAGNAKLEKFKMKTRLLPLLVCCVGALVITAAAQDEGKNKPEYLDVQSGPPMLGIHWARDFQPNPRANEAAKEAKPARPQSSPDMTNHGGVIMTTSNTQAIFWGTSWGSYSGDKISGMDDWYNGFGGSNYAKASTEYTGSNGRVGSTSTYSGHVIDTSASTGGNITSPILTEVCKVLANHGGADPTGNGYYPVYTDTPRGGARFCAWHSVGTCGGIRVQFAYFFKLDGDAGCDPKDTSTTHSQGLAAIANVSGHELSEAMTDPASPGAWYDSQGAENGDKCAWTFGAPYVTFSNGSKWKIQGEWSNAAYDSGTGGYPNSSGQKGCLAGN